MSSRFRDSVLALVAIAALGACEREQRGAGKDPMRGSVPTVSPDTIFPSGGKLPPLDPRAAAFERNAEAISKGQQLFGWMNCSGCHSHGGGGMGVALIDEKWRYGGRIDQIAASIMEGRPNGMPAWRGKLTDEQAWQLAAYVRSLGGLVSPDAMPGRNDDLNPRPPEGQLTHQPPVAGGTPSPAEQMPQ
jgi:cytochrome c oxidase cbb3-type subunit 3